MFSSKEKEQQLHLLEIHRQNLFHLLAQAGQYGGEIYAPLSTINSLRETRLNIQKIKQFLRDNDVEVDDHPDDQSFEYHTQKSKVVPKLHRKFFIISSLSIFAAIISLTLLLGTSTFQSIIPCQFLTTYQTGYTVQITGILQDRLESKYMLEEYQGLFRFLKLEKPMCIAFLTAGSGQLRYIRFSEIQVLMNTDDSLYRVALGKRTQITGIITESFSTSFQTPAFINATYVTLK